MESMNYLVGMAATVAFAVTAVLAVTPRGIDLFGACVLGIITAIGGGTVRDLILDVLAGRQTLLMTRELYATPVLLGCTLYVLLLYFLPEYRPVGAAVCCLCIFGVRAAAIHWDLRVPGWLTTKPKTD